MAIPKLSKADEKAHIYYIKNCGRRTNYSIRKVDGYKNLKFVHNGKVVQGRTIMKMCKERMYSKPRSKPRRGSKRSKSRIKAAKITDEEMKRKCKRLKRRLTIRWTRIGQKRKMYYLDGERTSKAKVLSVCKLSK